MWNTGLYESQVGIKIIRINISNLRYADNTTLIEESEEELKSFMMRVNEESEKSGLKLNMKKTKIMASSSITSWQIEEGKSGNWKILFSWSPKSLPIVTAAMKFKKKKKNKNTSSLEGKLTHLSNVLKSRDTTLPGKVHITKLWLFPIVMYKFELAYKEDWVMKNWCFQTMVPEKTLEPPLDSKKIKLVNPK